MVGYTRDEYKWLLNAPVMFHATAVSPDIDAVIKLDEGIHLNWPSPYTRNYREKRCS